MDGWARKEFCWVKLKKRLFYKWEGQQSESKLQFNKLDDNGNVKYDQDRSAGSYNYFELFGILK